MPSVIHTHFYISVINMMFKLHFIKQTMDVSRRGYFVVHSVTATVKQQGMSIYYFLLHWFITMVTFIDYCYT